MPTEAKALDVAKSLYENVFRDTGWPLEIISDRDTKFTVEVWTELFKIVGTKLKHGYAYHQRFDGQTEVMIRVVKEILRCFIDRPQTNWISLMPEVVQCLNNSVTIGIGYTPNHIFYGRKLLRPVDLKFRAVESIPTVAAFFEQHDYLKTVAESMIREGIIKYTEKFNATVPVAIIDERIKPGSLVLVDAKNIIAPNLKGRKSRKLQPKKLGPFKTAIF